MRGARGYPSPVATALGLVGVAVFIVGVIALAAGVTWLVVRISPTPGSKPKAEPADADVADRARRRSASSSGVYSRPCASATAS